ncbi:MAG: serine protease [Planctomycetota bacterium]
MIAFIVVFAAMAASGCDGNRTYLKNKTLAQVTPEQSAAIERCLKASVRFRGNGMRGAGVAIAPDGKVITAWHVLATNCSLSGKGGPAPCDMKYEIKTSVNGAYGKQSFENPAVLAASREGDVAIIDIGIPTPDCLPISSVGPKEGEGVFILGNSTGQLEAARGRYLGCGKDSPGTRMWLFVEGPAFHGDSGGALVNEKGELLGITSGAIRRESLVSIDDSKVRTFFSGKTGVVAVSPTPPQVVSELLRLRPKLVPTATTGDPEKGWGLIDFKVCPVVIGRETNMSTP